MQGEPSLPSPNTAPKLPIVLSAPYWVALAPLPLGQRAVMEYSSNTTLNQNILNPRTPGRDPATPLTLTGT